MLLSFVDPSLSRLLPRPCTFMLWALSRLRQPRSPLLWFKLWHFLSFPSKDLPFHVVCDSPTPLSVILPLPPASTVRLHFSWFFCQVPGEACSKCFEPPIRFSPFLLYPLPFSFFSVLREQPVPFSSFAGIGEHFLFL